MPAPHSLAQVCRQHSPAQPSPAQHSPAHPGPGQLAAARPGRSLSGPGRRSDCYVVRFLPLSPLEKNSWESFGRLEVWHCSTLVALAHLGASRSPEMHPGIRTVEAGVPSSAQLALVRFWARVALWPPKADEVLFVALRVPFMLFKHLSPRFLTKIYSAAAFGCGASAFGGLLRRQLPSCFSRLPKICF